MKRKFLKLVIALSLSVCFGLASVGGGTVRQAFATSVTESTTTENVEATDELDSTSKEFYDFLTKYSEFDSSKLSENDKKIYDNIKEYFSVYSAEKELGLEADEQVQAVNLLWGLAEEDVSDELFEEVLSYIGIDSVGFVEVVIIAFQDVLNDVETAFYNLIIDSFTFDYTKLTEEQKKTFDSVSENVNKFVEKYQVEISDEDKVVVSAIVYNLMSESTALSTKLLAEVVSYLGLDFSTFRELVGDFYEKFEEYISITAILYDYVDFVYTTVLGEEVSDEELDKVYNDLTEGILSARDFIYGALDKNGLYSDESASVLVEKLYNIVLLRNVDEGGLDFWTSKLDELVKGGKSLKDAVKDVAGQIMDSDEFKGLVKDFNLKY